MADYLTQADVSDFGEDLVSFAQRAAAHALAPTLQQIEANQAALGQALATEARRNLDRRVADLVPDYAALDRDPRWRSWLNQTESLSGRRRQDLLNDAIDRLDANRIAFFFKSWQREEAAAGQSPGRPSPHRAATRDAASAPSNQPVYTNASIAELYSRHRKGELVGPAWERIEADLFRAQHEGRVRATPWLTK